MSQSIVVEYNLPQAPAKVWRALTDAKLLASWLMENDFQAVVGHRFNFRAQPMPGWDGVVHCEVLTVEPEKKLAYAWRGGSGESKLDTVVTWTLSPGRDGGTLLRLDHDGFLSHNAFAFDTMGKGWRSHLAERMAKAIAEIQ